MMKMNEIFDKMFEKIPGYLFGLFAFLIGILGDSLALIFSPEYVMWRYSVSLLGHQTGGPFLRVGLIVSNILAIPFIIYLGRVIKDEDGNELIRKLAIGSGFVTSISAIFTGTFSGDINIVIPFLSDVHGFFAFVSWFSAAVMFALFSYLMAKNSKFSKNIRYFGYLVSGIIIFYLIPFIITNICNALPELCYTFGRFLVVYVNASLEWLVIFSITTWYLANSIYIKHKKL